MMTVDEYNEIFNKFVSEHNGHVPYSYGNTYTTDARGGYYTNKRDDSNFIQWSWTTGGVTGGSCWTHNNRSYTSTETEPNETLLDLFLSEYFPNVTFLNYKKIINSVVCETFSENEYYGNCTNYTVKSITKYALMKALKDTGHLE